MEVPKQTWGKTDIISAYQIMSRCFSLLGYLSLLIQCWISVSSLDAMLKLHPWRRCGKPAKKSDEITGIFRFFCKMETTRQCESDIEIEEKRNPFFIPCASNVCQRPLCAAPGCGVRHYSFVKYWRYLIFFFEEDNRPAPVVEFNASFSKKS